MSGLTGGSTPSYDPEATLRQGRAVYFERYGFGDGGYDGRSLYQHRELPEAVLERRVKDVRAELGLAGPPPEPGLRHYLGMWLIALVGLKLYLMPLALASAAIGLVLR
jgi:hypothetical protein